MAIEQEFPWLSGVDSWFDDVAESYQGYIDSPDKLEGARDAALHIGANFANAAQAGLEGVSVGLISRGNPLNDAVDAINLRMQDPLWVWEAETPAGQALVQTAETIEAPLEQMANWAGEKTFQATGNPGLATMAFMAPETVGEVLFGKGAGMAARGAGRVAEAVAENAGTPVPLKQAQEGAIRIADEDAYSTEDRYDLTGQERTLPAVESAIRSEPEVVAQQNNIFGGVDDITHGEAGGVLTPAIGEALEGINRSSMPANRLQEELVKRGVTPNEMKFFGLDKEFAESGNDKISVDRIKRIVENKNDNDLIIRRAGDEVLPRADEVEVLAQKELAAKGVEDSVLRAERGFDKAVRDYEPKTVEDVDAMETARREFTQALKMAKAGHGGAARKHFDNAGERLRDRGIDLRGISDNFKDLRYAVDAKDKARGADWPAHQGGTRPADWASDYKMGGDNLSDQVLTFNMPTEAYGGRGANTGDHYSGRPAEGEFIAWHARTSRRPVDESTFEKDGVLYDETTRHVDEDQSDMVQADPKYGRDLTPEEFDETDNLKRQRSQINRERDDISGEVNALRAELSAMEDRLATDRTGLKGSQKFNDRMGAIRDELTSLEAHDSELKEAARALGARESQIKDVTMGAADIPFKDKMDRRVNTTLVAMRDAIRAGDEWVTMASDRQQGKAYDQLQYVEDIRWDGENFVDAQGDGYGYGEELPESELLKHFTQEELDRAKVEFMDEDSFYEAERGYYVENEAENIKYDLEEETRYKDDDGDYHDTYEEAAEYSDDPEEVDGIVYDGEFHPDRDIDDFADELAEEVVPLRGSFIKENYDWDGDNYSQYMENNDATLHVGDDLITNKEVAGTARWYTDEYNQKAFNQIWRQLGFKGKAPTEHKYVPDGEGGQEAMLGLRMTDEVIEAMENAPLFQRYQEPGSREGRRAESMERRLKERGGALFPEEAVGIELFSPYPRGTKKATDPRPKLWPEEVDM